ncbi:MAG: OFA family MFS transporter [Planctomycetia bacterium]|nr:OFA family MFS transporter [Planctomycetia bacterium]
MSEDRPAGPAISRWWRVVGGLSMNLALGSLYAWSVFVAPLEQRFGWKRTETSMAFTIAVVAFALAFILAGRLQDRFGPFWVSVTGGLLVSLGVFMCAYTQSLPWLYFWFGVVVGAGNGFGYATPIPVMAKWFPDHRGLAVGLAVAGYGGGSAIFGPLCSSYLIPHHGLAATFRILGAVFLVMTLVGAFLLRNPPEGYRPEGWVPPPPTAPSAATPNDFTPGEVLRTPTFYLMWVAFALGASSGLMVISQLLPFAKEKGIAAAAASTALFVGAAGSASGRTLSGWMSDGLGRLNVLRLMIGVSVAAMPLLYLVGGSVPGLFAMVFVVYWCFGTQLSVNASTAADFWGTKNAGINYGMLYTAYGVAGVIGPRIGSTLFDKYHSYQAAFDAAAVLAAVALVCELLARRPVPGAVRVPGGVTAAPEA